MYMYVIDNKLYSILFYYNLTTLNPESGNVYLSQNT